MAEPLSGESEKRKGKSEGVEVEPGGKRRLQGEKGQGAARAPASRSAGWASASAAR